MAQEPKVILHPVINSLQKLAVYDLKDWLYIVGSNSDMTSFRLLKILRMHPKELIIKDDGLEYTTSEVKSIIFKDCKTGKVPVKGVSAFGIVGFVRFMEGYYMILITKRRPVAAVGLHHIYKIEETTMVYIPYEAIKISHPDEPRYLKMFQSIDLSSNFYFSYSYDITNSLQVNMAVPKVLKDSIEEYNGPKKDFWEFQVRSHPNKRFVWNEYLTSMLEGKVSSEWIIHITHGFVGQFVLSIFGRPVHIALIARRSNRYAGTRFLKRGANFDGDVANEVETEQIVEDMGVSSWLVCPRISSFVQVRGSIPGHWSQDITKIVAKPAITYDLSDPFVQTAGRHFKGLIDRYGTPVVVLNLVKQREKKKHESTLSEQFISDIKYLNQFLAPQHNIVYVRFDMARKNKGNRANVLGKLAKIAETAISKTGVYFCGKDVEMQCGIIRVNCVDCLDRTNTAQFALGKYALALQLNKLGLFGDGQLDFDCDCTRLLEVLYEDHGDTLALQYGGSQLVHRIKTYRKTAPWTSQGNDIMQTLSRYYSNTFSDAEKQHAINLFLGLHKPYQSDVPLWETTSDFYLHNQSVLTIPRLMKERLPLTQWWGEREVQPLALAVRHRKAFVAPLADLANVDAYSDYHRPEEITELAKLFTFTMGHTVRDFAPPNVLDLSPFTVRSGRRREEVKGARTSQYSSTSCSNSSSDDSFQESDEEEIKTEGSSPARQSNADAPAPPWKIPPPIIEFRCLTSKDNAIYKQYVDIGKQAIHPQDNYIDSIKNLIRKGKQDTRQTDVPRVSQSSLEMYQSYVNKRYETLESCITSDQVEKYARYRNNQLFVYPAVGWGY